MQLFHHKKTFDKGEKATVISKEKDGLLPENHSDLTSVLLNSDNKNRSVGKRNAVIGNGTRDVRASYIQSNHFVASDKAAENFENKHQLVGDEEEESSTTKTPGKEKKNWLGSIGGFLSAFGFFSFLAGIVLGGQQVSGEIVFAFGMVAPPILIGLGLMTVAASILIMRKKKQSKGTKKGTLINMIAGYVGAGAFLLTISLFNVFPGIVFPVGSTLLSQFLVVLLVMAIVGALLLNLIHLLMKIGKDD